MSIHKLSRNFYLHEFTRSQTAARRGISNDFGLGTQVHNNLERLCSDVLQPLRDALGATHITSGYRSPELNTAIGGSKRSQHCFGCAADIVVNGCTPYEVCEWLAESNLPYDQLIHEFGQWAHISIAAPGDMPRKQTLTAYRKAGKTQYTYGIRRMGDV